MDERKEKIKKHYRQDQQDRQDSKSPLMLIQGSRSAAASELALSLFRPSISPLLPQWLSPWEPRLNEQPVKRLSLIIRLVQDSVVFEGCDAAAGVQGRRGKEKTSSLGFSNGGSLRDLEGVS
jgi:hypothetical protein